MNILQCPCVLGMIIRWIRHLDAYLYPRQDNLVRDIISQDSGHYRLKINTMHLKTVLAVQAIVTERKYQFNYITHNLKFCNKRLKNKQNSQGPFLRYRKGNYHASVGTWCISVGFSALCRSIILKCWMNQYVIEKKLALVLTR